MEERKYTTEEIDELKSNSVLTYIAYSKFKREYFLATSRAGRHVKTRPLKEIKNDLNASVERCKEDLPKSLISKLEIKKVE